MLINPSRLRRSPLRRIIILVLCFGISACANPGFQNVSQSLGKVDFHTVAILPFTGEIKYAALATETFTLHLIGIQNVKLIQPNDVKLTIKRMGFSTRSGITVFEATKVAKALGATAIIMGNAAGYTNGATLNGFATVKILMPVPVKLLPLYISLADCLSHIVLNKLFSLP